MIQEVNLCESTAAEGLMICMSFVTRGKLLF